MAENPQITPFFTKPAVAETADEALAKIGALVPQSPFERGRNAIIIVALNLIKQIPEEFGAHCAVNIHYIGTNFVKSLQIDSDSPEHLGWLFSQSLRFLSEYAIMSAGSFSDFGRIHLDGAECFESYWQVEEFASENINQFTGKNRLQVKFALYGVPALILKYWLHSDEGKNTREHHAAAESIKGAIAEWEKTIEEKEKRVENVREIFGAAGDRLNIDGLAAGFEKLLAEKERAKEQLGWQMFRSRLLIMFLLLAIFSGYAFLLYSGEMLTTQHILLGAPLSLLAFIVLYFYRVELAEYKSVCTQILQIQLRKTLCQFIQNYTSSDIADKADKKSAMGKFENVVFSGMVADDSQIPATFEGLEQLAKLVKAIRGEK